MKKAQLNRRTFIRSGTTLLALPMLEAMVPQALAQAATDPKRYVFFYLASGTYMKPNNGANWQPGTVAGPLNASNLPPVFQPFAANVNDFSILRGVYNTAKMMASDTDGSITNNHVGAMASYLTNTPVRNWKSNVCGIDGNSLDVEMALRNNWKAFALTSGGDSWNIGETNYPYHWTPSYRNGAKVPDVWGNPYKLFTSPGLFMTTVAPSTPSGNSSLPSLSRNRSILDGAVQALQTLKNKLGRADQQRLDDYFSSLRALERTLAASSPGGSCNATNPVPLSLDNEDTTIGDTSRLDYVQRMRAFNDVMALAFKCNRAQIFSVVTEYEGHDRRYRGQVGPDLNYRNSPVNDLNAHNDIAHWDWTAGRLGEETMRNVCISRDRLMVSFAIDLVNKLKMSLDPSGAPILDNTIIEVGHGMMEGNHMHDAWGGDQGVNGVVRFQHEHNPQGMPLMLAGGRNMITPGRFHVLPNVDLKDVHYTIAQRLGSGLTSWRGSSRLLTL